MSYVALVEASCMMSKKTDYLPLRKKRMFHQNSVWASFLASGYSPFISRFFCGHAPANAAKYHIAAGIG